MPKIFISYSSKDRALVDELAADLELLFDDVSVWYDRELNRSGGHLWWNLILEQIRLCDVFIYALSPQVLQSEPCRREHGYAHALGKPVLPLLMADVEFRYLPVELQAAQLVRFQQRSREQQRSLKASLRNMPPAPPLPQPLPTPPDAPLDPVGVLHDRITRLTSDPDQQRLVILDVEDLYDEAAFAAHVPELLLRLLERDDVLTVRNLRRVQDLQARIGAGAGGGGAAATTGGLPSAPTVRPSPVVPPSAPTPARPSSSALLPAPFAWVPIPVGKVTLGGNDGANGGYIEAATVFDVAQFDIAKYPVTNAQYGLFVAAGGYDQRRWWTEAGWAAREQGIAWNDSAWATTGKAWTQPRYWGDAKWNGADYPVVGVSWYEAVAYCAWLSAETGERIMLPTDAQWQRAAQGDTRRVYPWGDKFDKTRANTSESGIGQTTPVTRYAGRGDSPYGVVDMSGNVWEWCATDYETGSDDLNETDVRVCRGGAWFGDVDGARAAFRNWGSPLGRLLNVGLRLARS